MALKTLSTLRSNVAILSGKDVTNSDDLALIDLQINRTYMDIVRRHPWTWLRKEGYFTTVAPHSTGSISISGLVVTGVGTNFTSGDVGRYLHFKDLGDECLRVTQVNSVTELLVNTLPSSSTLPTGLYNIFQCDYAIDSGAGEIIEYIEDLEDSTKIYPVSMNNLQEVRPNFGAIDLADPEYFTVIGRDDDNKIEIRLSPIPDNVRQYRFIAYDEATSLSTAADSIFLPERFQDVVEEGALTRIWTLQGGRPDLVQMHAGLYEAYIANMIKSDKNQYQQIFPKSENDVPRTDNGLGFTLPPEYGNW